MRSSRREFLRRASFALAPLALIRQGGGDTAQVPAKSVTTGAVAADTLNTTTFPVGRAGGPLGALDNDPGVIAIERRLRCSCGCTLDVYTCRTTDFSCTYSPAMHAKVVAQVRRGTPPDAVVAWFVAQPEYGEKVLMAPPARGFNLMGYLVPGLTVTTVGLALVAWLARRHAGRWHPLSPATGRNDHGVAVPTADDLARLRRALDDVES